MLRTRFLGVLVIVGALAAAPALATRVEIGAFGGVAIPIQQDDNDLGPQFGIRLPIRILPYLGLEPFYSGTAGGDVQKRFIDYDYTRSGMNVHSFGVNATLLHLGFAQRFSFDPYLGLAAQRLSRSGSKTETHLGYDFGIGCGVAVSQRVSIHVRGEFDMIDVGDTSRKYVNVTAGLHYRLAPR